MKNINQPINSVLLKILVKSVKMLSLLNESIYIVGPSLGPLRKRCRSLYRCIVDTVSFTVLAPIVMFIIQLELKKINDFYRFVI